MVGFADEIIFSLKKSGIGSNTVLTMSRITEREKANPKQV